jgi:hypothetical protein
MDVKVEACIPPSRKTVGSDFTHRKEHHSSGGFMKDDEPLPVPPQVQPVTETHPDNADRTIHHYDAVDVEFYVEGAGDA